MHFRIKEYVCSPKCYLEWKTRHYAKGDIDAPKERTEQDRDK